MSDSVDMPPADLSDQKYKTQKSYAKYLEAKNFIRSVRAKKLLFRKRAIAGMCTAFVIGTYAFTIASFQEEKFLDDFEEPPRQIKNN